MLARCTHTLIMFSISHIHTPITCTSSLVHIPQSHVSHTHTQSHVLSYTYPITCPLIHIPNHVSSLIHLPNHMSSHTHTQSRILSHTHTQPHVLSYTYPITYPLSYTYPTTCPLIHIPNHISSLIIVHIHNDMSSHTHT